MVQKNSLFIFLSYFLSFNSRKKVLQPFPQTPSYLFWISKQIFLVRNLNSFFFVGFCFLFIFGALFLQIKLRRKQKGVEKLCPVLCLGYIYWYNGDFRNIFWEYLLFYECWNMNAAANLIESSHLCAFHRFVQFDMAFTIVVPKYGLVFRCSEF